MSVIGSTLTAGFDHVFSMEKLQTFSPYELNLLLCGEQVPNWTREDLLNYTEPKYGYNKERWVNGEEGEWRGHLLVSCSLIVMDT